VYIQVQTSLFAEKAKILTEEEQVLRCVCVCVCERERDREWVSEFVRERECVCGACESINLCVCVC